MTASTPSSPQHLLPSPAPSPPPSGTSPRCALLPLPSLATYLSHLSTLQTANTSLAQWLQRHDAIQPHPHPTNINPNTVPTINATKKPKPNPRSKPSSPASPERRTRARPHNHPHARPQPRARIKGTLGPLSERLERERMCRERCMRFVEGLERVPVEREKEKEAEKGGKEVVEVEVDDAESDEIAGHGTAEKSRDVGPSSGKRLLRKHEEEEEEERGREPKRLGEGIVG